MLWYNHDISRKMMTSNILTVKDLFCENESSKLIYEFVGILKTKEIALRILDY